MRLCPGLVALILGVLAAPAAAQTEPLPAGTTLVPRDGQVWTASSWPGATPFEMQEFVAYASDYAELPEAYAFAVASSPATGPDGLLAAPIDRYLAPAQPLHPGIYAALTALGARWLGTPGTYYWQASYADDDGDTYASAVRALTILAQPPPDPPAVPITVAPPPAASRPVDAPRPPSPGTVRIAVRRAIAAATHRSPRGLVYRCAGSTCHPSWRDPRYRYRGRLHLEFGTSAISATFTGTRVARKHGHPRTITWATSF
jgi:hypothetical protein